jgi:flagellar motor switch/type III secretory pathway protein FliN
MGADFSDLDSLLDGDGDIVTINPEIIEAGEEIGATLLKAGFESWSTYLGRGVLYTEGGTEYHPAAEALAGEKGVAVVSTLEWKGDHEGELHLIVPEAGAKSAIAYFLAVAMGTEADPESVQMDEEGLDSYKELVNTLLGQGTQALRGKLGGAINISLLDTRSVDFVASHPAVEIGTEEFLAHSGQLIIEGQMPVTVYLLMSVPVTGMSAEIQESASVAAASAAASTAKRSAKKAVDTEDIAKYIKVPVIVELARTKMRMEMIESLSPGSIIEFRKLSGELLDVFAGNTRFAQGEVIITNEHFGIQIRKLVDVRASIAANS